MTRKIGISVTSALLVLGSLAFGCGDDDDNGGDNMDGGGLLDANMNNPDGGDAGPAPQTESYTGVVVESTNVTNKLANQKVRLFDPKTGQIYPNQEQTSNASGTVTFPARPIGSGALVVGSTGFTDTWNYPPSRTGEDELIRQGTVQAAQGVPGLAMYTVDQNASPLAGSVLWRNKTTGKDEFVGCVTIEEANGVKDVRYFNNTLPASPVTRPLAKGTKPPQGDPSNPSNEPEAGKYFIGNVEGGLRTIVAKIGDQKVGESTFFIVPRSQGTPVQGIQGGANLSLGSIWVSPDSPTNPTPAGCN